MSDNVKKILLVGTGPMAISYAKVLQGLNVDFTVVGRGKPSAENFYQQTGTMPVTGGVDKFAAQNDMAGFSHAILATGTEALAGCLKSLLDKKVVNILIEKPAAVSINELNAGKDVFMPFHETILVAYNRRFYASVFEAEKLIEEDGGLQAMNFEFTEWTHKIDPSKKVTEVLNNWFFANSTHVVDLAFFLAGKPIQWSAFSKSGKLDWHDKTIFSGAGITNKGVVFSYLSHWESAGRWGVELFTEKRKIFLKPLEGVLIQPKGTVNAVSHEFDDDIDKTFKPGLYRQVESFLNNKHDRFINIKQQLDIALEVYKTILS